MIEIVWSGGGVFTVDTPRPSHSVSLVHLKVGDLIAFWSEVYPTSSFTLTVISAGCIALTTHASADSARPWP